MDTPATLPALPETVPACERLDCRACARCIGRALTDADATRVLRFDAMRLLRHAEPAPAPAIEGLERAAVREQARTAADGLARSLYEGVQIGSQAEYLPDLRIWRLPVVACRTEPDPHPPYSDDGAYALARFEHLAVHLGTLELDADTGALHDATPRDHVRRELLRLRAGEAAPPPGPRRRPAMLIQPPRAAAERAAEALLAARAWMIAACAPVHLSAGEPAYDAAADVWRIPLSLPLQVEGSVTVGFLEVDAATGTVTDMPSKDALRAAEERFYRTGGVRSCRLAGISA